MRVRVLIVDDDQQVRRMLRRLLTRHPAFEVVGMSATGDAGVALVADLQPDLVLMDMDMPGMTGTEATQAVKSAFPQTKVVALSGRRDEETVAEMIRAGASGYLLKGSDAADLIESLLAVAQGQGALAHEVTPHVLEDLAELYAREQERANALEDLDRMKREFMNVVSHELKTPLTSIKGGLSTLQHRWEAMNDELKLSFVEMMDKQAERLSRMIRQILTVSGIQRGSFESASETFDLAEAAREAVAETGADPRVAFEGEPTIVSADRGQIVEVIRSLVDNAARFTEGKITVRIASSDHGASVEVADEGPGMDPALLERLMQQPFIQADSSATRTAGGLGLSLYVANQVLDALGGRLEAETDPSAGSRFTVVLPNANQSG
jgi:signal transduction histidine kinase